MAISHSMVRPCSSLWAKLTSSRPGFYFKAAGVGNMLFMVLCTALTPFLTTIPFYWLKWWTESETDRPAFYITGYVMILLGAWISTNGIMWSSIIRVAPTSGEVLHRRLLAAIMGYVKHHVMRRIPLSLSRAPLLYFSQNDSGGILNRYVEYERMIFYICFANLKQIQSRYSTCRQGTFHCHSQSLRP